jgi:hypothetical protein
MATSPDTTGYYTHQFSGLGSVGSYQVSGYPYITGSTTLANGGEDQISFPGVTKSITVMNRLSGSGEAPDIRIHFAPLAAGNVATGNHFVILTANKDSITMNVKCNEIYISRDDGTAGNASYTVFAEVTGIGSEQMFHLTGSGITE